MIDASLALVLMVACGSTPSAPAGAIDAVVLIDASPACTAIQCDLLRCNGLMTCDVATDVCVCPENGASCNGVPVSCSISCAGFPVVQYCEPRGLCFCEPVFCQHS